VPSLFQWVDPLWSEVPWLVAMGVTALSAHYCMTRAFAAAPLTVTQPVTFLQLVWATLLGVFVFGEPADGFVILGGSVILSAVIFISWREAQIRKAALTPDPNAAKL